MRTSTILTALAALAMVALPTAVAVAHDWYPVECCSNLDCAPVTSVAQTTPISSDGVPQLVVTTKVGTAIVPVGFKTRESKDHRMHACLKIYDHNPQTRLICLFMPPQM